MSERTPRIRRRAVLGAAGTATLAGLAGCTAVVNWIGDKVLGDVNLFNNTADRQEGSIVVTDSGGETVLDDSFDLPPSDDENGDGDSSGDDEGASVFEDVWTGSDTYEASVTLADGFDVQGETEASASVSIDDPDESKLAVAFGADEFEDGITFATGEKLSEFRENPVDGETNVTQRQQTGD